MRGWLGWLDEPGPRVDWLAAGALFIIALVPRLAGMEGSGLWFGEAQLAWRSQTLGTALVQPGDPIPPLYPLLAFFASRFLGPQEFGLRLPSLLAGAALAPAAYAVLRLAGGRRLALAGALLALFSPYSLYLSQQAQPGALGAVLALLQFGCFWAALAGEQAPAWRWLAATTALLALAHPWAPALFLAELAVMAAARRAPARLLAPVVGGVALWGLGLAPFWAAAGRLAGPARGAPWAPFPPGTPPVPYLAPAETALLRLLSYPLAGFPTIGPMPALFGLAALAAGSAALGLALAGRARGPAVWSRGALATIGLAVAGQAVYPLYLLPGPVSIAGGLVLATVALGLGQVAARPARYLLLGLLLAVEAAACWGYWRSPPRSAMAELATDLRTARPDAAFVTRKDGTGPSLMAPLTYYLRYLYLSRLPLLELPTLRPVPEGYLPLGTYADNEARRMGEPFSAEVYGRFVAALAPHKCVALVGTPWEVDGLLQAARGWRLTWRGSYFGYLEGPTQMSIAVAPGQPAPAASPGAPIPGPPTGVFAVNACRPTETQKTQLSITSSPSPR